MWCGVEGEVGAFGVGAEVAHGTEALYGVLCIVFISASSS